MEFIVWDREKIALLSDLEKEQWFEVLNNGLEEDRGISLDDEHLEDKQKEIKEDYYSYLHECLRTNDYISYFVLYESTKIVSVCRVISKSRLFYLEGLETHRDFQNKGYAKCLVNFVLQYLKDIDVSIIKARVSKQNTASIKLFTAVGFVQNKETDNKYFYEYKIMDKPRYLPWFYNMYVLELFWGIPYHRDNNKRFYDKSHKGIIGTYISLLIFINVFIIIVNFIGDTVTLYMGLYINVFLIVIGNILNWIRYSKHNDLEYRKRIRALSFAYLKFFVFSLLVLLAVNILF